MSTEPKLAPLYRITVELLTEGEPEWNAHRIGIYCFDTGRHPLNMTRIDGHASRFSFDLRSGGIGLYICDERLNFTFGPWYQSPERKAVEGDI